MANVSGQREKGEIKDDAPMPGVLLLFKVIKGLDDFICIQGSTDKRRSSRRREARP
jgi:hypothetical protein